MFLKISSKLEWLREYVESVSDLVPINNLTHIKGLKPQNNLRKQQTHAVLTEYTDKTFGIVIHTFSKYVHPETHEVRFTPYNTMDILGTLAHELAHLLFIDFHCPEHKRLELKILRRFMTRLKKSGYHSEEIEEKESKNLP